MPVILNFAKVFSLIIGFEINDVKGVKNKKPNKPFRHTIQLAISQAFTAPWEIKIEQMAVILNFVKVWSWLVVFKFIVKYSYWNHDQKSKWPLFAQFLFYKEL